MRIFLFLCSALSLLLAAHRFSLAEHTGQHKGGLFFLLIGIQLLIAAALIGGHREDRAPKSPTSSCSAPLKSSHLGCLLRPKLDWASIAQRLMRPLLIVPLHPVPNDPSGLLECLKHVLPDTLFFETAKEPLNNPVLLRRVGRDEFLLEAIVATGLSKSTALEAQPIVASENRRPARTERAEPLETGGFHCAFRLLRPTPQCEFVPDHFPIMTINHGRQMRPAILSTGDMRHIHGPPFVALTRSTHPASHARPRGGDSLMHQPALLLQHAVDRFAIHHQAVSTSQLHPESAIPKRRILLDPIPQSLQPGRRGTAPTWSRFTCSI